ncbi:MAG: HlyD family efflux transporter periplasmic adaptor subunit [Patescibacteria group bacterium]
MKNKKWLILILLLIILGMGVFAFFRFDEKDNYVTEEVERGDIRKAISVTGEIVSKKPVRLNFESSGRIKEVNFKEGEEVAEGEVFAALENQVLSRQAEKAEAALKKARAESGAEDDQIREIEESVDNAEDYLEAVEEYQEEVVESAELDYENAKQYYEEILSQYEELKEGSEEDSAALRETKLALINAENSKEKSEKALEVAKKNKKMNLLSAENSLKTSEEKLKTAESDYVKAGRSASVEAAEADYKAVLEKLENSFLKAPVSGVVSKVNYEKGEVLGNALSKGDFGEIISSDFILEVDVPESDISEIDLGQEAEITFDAFSEKDKVGAEVVDIEPSSTVVQGVVYYKAKMRLKENDLNIKAGMTVDAEVLIDEKRNVLKISRRAVQNKEEGDFVEVAVGDSRVIEKKVETGLEDDMGYVEINSGLQEGDKVVVMKKDE